MELLKLSKFKLQLRTLISEIRELREKEHYVSDQLHLLQQKRKENEEVYNGKLTRLQYELATSNELCQKLETKVNSLQNDNTLLENKQKELQGTINRLLQSRESFVKVYEDSTCQMKQAIDHRERKIAVLSEKIDAHFSLFSSIEKEALSVKKAVNNAEHLLSEKEELVDSLKIKMDRVTTLETDFVEKIKNLESKLRNNEDGIRRKDAIILELEAKLEAAKISDKGQAKINELQETLSAKEVIIQSLISEKKALHFELWSLQIIIKKIQDTIEHMNEESKKAFSSMLASKECEADKDGNHRTEDATESTRENSPHESIQRGVAEVSDSLLCYGSQEHGVTNKALKDTKTYDSCVSEAC